MSGQWSEGEFPKMESIEADRVNYGHSEARYSAIVPMKRDKISLYQAIEDATSAAEKLAAMVHELTLRLEPVRREPGDEKAMASEDMSVSHSDYGSPFAAKVMGISDIIYSSQARIKRVMDDLDL